MLNRTPPEGSLSAELLGLRKTRIPSGKADTVARIKDLTETLSDFNSCISSGSSSEEDSSSVKEKLKGKRKRIKSPEKDDQSKKANMKVSPEACKAPTNS